MKIAFLSFKKILKLFLLIQTLLQQVLGTGCDRVCAVLTTKVRCMTEKTYLQVHRFRITITF